MADRRPRFAIDTIEPDGSSVNQDHTNEFARLLEWHEPHVYAYIVSLVPNWTEAEEILQETYIRLFERADDWDPSRSFRAWACAVARYQIMTYRRRVRREKLRFGQQFVETVAAYRHRTMEEFEPRAEALEKCLAKLPPEDRRLIELVYHEDASVEHVAEMTNRSPNAASKALSKIRKALHECIARTLRRSEQP